MEASRRGRTPRQPSRIDKPNAGEALMRGYVPHARPTPAQTEYVRQIAATQDDRGDLVDMLLGETTEQTASIYAAALEDPNLAELLAESLEDPRLRRQLAIMGELAGGCGHEWCAADGGACPRCGVDVHDITARGSYVVEASLRRAA